MLWAISGGAGFLGLHLARRALADGHKVRTLDLAPLDEPSLEGRVDELRGDIRDPARARELVAGAWILVHAAAALPISGARDEIRSVNVEGTATLLAAALEARVRRVVFISTTAVYGVPETHPIDESAPLHGVGHYGRSKIEAEEVLREFERRGLAAVVIRPKTFIGPERLGVFEILFLYGQAEVRRHGRPDREVQEQVRRGGLRQPRQAARRPRPRRSSWAI